MTSQLATVLTCSSLLDDQHGNRQRVEEGPEPLVEDGVDHKVASSPSSTPVSDLLQPCSVPSLTSSGGDAPSVNGTSTPPGSDGTVGTTERRAGRDAVRKTSGIKQPTAAKTGVPVLRSQPIGLKLVVPRRREQPITNANASLTKDPPSCSQFTTTPLLLSAEAVSKNTRDVPLAPFSSATIERQTKEVMGRHVTDEPKVETFQRMEVEEGERHNESKVTDDRNRVGYINCGSVLKEALLSGADRVGVPGQRGMVEEQTERGREEEDTFPLNSQAEEPGLEEQTEPLDLTLPKKRESKDGRRTGRFLDESFLIMEVDEFEGDGDRDVVEEDDVDAPTTLPMDAFCNPLPSPSFFSTSVFTSLSSIDYDPENLLLIDDQGIPYTLSPEGRKVPQVETSPKPEGGEDPVASGPRPAVQHNSPTAAERQGGSFVGLNLSQSLKDNPHTLSAPSTATVADMLSPGAEPTANAELLTSARLVGNSAAQGVAVKDEAAAAPLPQQPRAAPVPNNQAFQILTNPATNTPFLLLSNPTSSCSSSLPQLSSPGPVNLSLPLSVAPNSLVAPGTQMLLLLSSVPASPGQPVATSTAIAVLDPSTGQLSQITASSIPHGGLPQGVGKASALGSSALSHPVIRLSPNNPPVILSGVGGGGSSLASAPILHASLSVPVSLQNSGLAHVQKANPSGRETEAISADSISVSAPVEQNTKPSSAAPLSSSSSPRPSAPASAACDPSNGPVAPESTDPNATSDPSSCHLASSSEALQLEDHHYFSSSGPYSTATAPSPPMGPILPSSNPVDHLDPLDPLSPASSPNSSLGPRRVLYCHLCPRVFFYLSDLERHAITHSQTKPHVCQQCGKAFKRSSHLQRHKHIHTGQRNYVCPICAKRFREAGELQRHQRVHTGEKPYQCQLCHTRFAERNTLRRHTKRKHPYHQVALEMLGERRGGGGGGGGGGGTGTGVQEEEESAEWYSSIVSNLDNSEAETEDIITT